MATDGPLYAGYLGSKNMPYEFLCLVRFVKRCTQRKDRVDQITMWRKTENFREMKRKERGCFSNNNKKRLYNQINS